MAKTKKTASVPALDSEEEERIERNLEFFKHHYKRRNGKEPDEKLVKIERQKLIKRISLDKQGLSNAEKEEGQYRCLYRILCYEKEHLSIEQMSAALFSSGYKTGSSTKTIYRRILPELMAHGIQKDSEGKYFMPESRIRIEYEKRWEQEASEQMDTELIISNFLETLKDTPVYEKAKEYIEKSFRIHRRRARVGQEDDSNINHSIVRNQRRNRISDEYVSRVIFMGAPAATIRDEFWKTIYDAIKSNTYVKIQYTPEGRKKSQSYTVKPFQLVFDNGFWDLWGECISFEHKGNRLFNLSRISKVEIPDEKRKFELPENYDFRSTLAGNFGCYNDEVALDYKIKIKADSYACTYIKDRIWGEFQEITKEKDGYILEFEATQYKPILRWVLSWGSDVVPLEPKELVEDWKRIIGEMSRASKAIKG